MYQYLYLFVICITMCSYMCTYGRNQIFLKALNSSTNTTYKHFIILSILSLYIPLYCISYPVLMFLAWYDCDIYVFFFLFLFIYLTNVWTIYFTLLLVVLTCSCKALWALCMIGCSINVHYYYYIISLLLLFNYFVHKDV